MNMESLVDYIVVGTVVALSLFLAVRFVKNILTGKSSSCGCCSDGKNCAKK